MSECEHDKRFVGVFLLPPEDKGCIACAFERVSAELKDTKEDATEFYARNKQLEKLLALTWDIARDNHLDFRDRIDKIMKTIREKPDELPKRS